MGKSFIKTLATNVTIDQMVWVNFQNLFNGNKQLGDNINRVLNDNWKELLEDVKQGCTEVFDTVLNHLLNNFFSKVSLEEAFD
jgi:trans-2-enoyl-CoA reductase